MKMKVFALILCIILCFSVLMVGCQKECTGHVDEDKNAKCDICEADVCLEHKDENGDAVCDVCQTAIPQPCDHADTDANSYCDKCNAAIVVIEQPAASEKGERVNMVVNEIPKDVALNTYIKDYAPKTYTSYTKVDEKLNDRYGYDYKHIEATQDAPAKAEYTVKNIISGETVIKLTLDTDSYVDNYNGILRVRDVNTYTYYSYAGEKLLAQAGAPYTDYEEANDWNYITLGEKVYVIDGETYAVVAKALDLKTLVIYPNFDEKNEKYGYVYEYDYYNGDIKTIYVYNRAKVAECLYSYDVPSYYESADKFVLENGNILVQAKVELNDDAASYDFFENGNKYDIVYDMIDPAAKTVKSVEFGYYINTLSQPEENSFYTDKALNVAKVYCVTNDRVDMNNVKTMVIDNELKVLFDVTSVFGDNMRNVVAVAKDRYLVERFMGYDDYYNQIIVNEVVDGKGAHIAYLSASADTVAGAVRYNGKLYGFDMQPIEAVAEYNIRAVYSSYAILQKDAEYFLYNSGKDVKAIGTDYYMAYEFGYVIGNGAEKVIYRADGEELFRFEGYIDDYNGYDGIFELNINGQYYFVK